MTSVSSYFFYNKFCQHGAKNINQEQLRKQHHFLFCSTGPESLSNACYGRMLCHENALSKRDRQGTGNMTPTSTRQNTGWKNLKNGSFWFLKVNNPFYTLRAIDNIGLFFLRNFLFFLLKGRLEFISRQGQVVTSFDSVREPVLKACLMLHNRHIYSSHWSKI